jgi:hypothetical protein
MTDIRTLKVSLPLIQAPPIEVAITGALTASHGVDVSITTTPTAVPFNTNDFDSAGSIDHDTVTNNSSFVVTQAGTYEFIFQPQVASLSNNTGNATFWLRKNGTTPIANTTVTYKVNHIGTNNSVVLSVIVPLLANEYIELMAQASANSEYVLDYTVGSGAGATARPATPSCIVNVKGWV